MLFREMNQFCQYRVTNVQIQYLMPPTKKGVQAPETTAANSRFKPVDFSVLTGRLDLPQPSSVAC